MGDDEPDFDYRGTLTREILAMRHPVKCWQQASRPHGVPVDLADDRAPGDAVRHLRAAAAALDPASGIADPPVTGTHLSINALGRTRVPAAASPADRARLVQDARRDAETTPPGARGGAE